MKCAIYARCSLLLNQSPENQLIPLREYARSRGLEIHDEFVDHGVSGARERRPSLDRMLAEARRGRFKILIVAALDRVGRNVKHLLTLLDELNSHGVKLISLREAIDLTSPQGQLIFTVLAAVAQMEREIIATRSRESLAAKKMAAKQNGTSWRCGRPLLVTEEVKKQILTLRDKGLSIRSIEKALNKTVSHSAIGRVIKGAVSKP